MTDIKLKLRNMIILIHIREQYKEPTPISLEIIVTNKIPVLYTLQNI